MARDDTPTPSEEPYTLTAHAALVTGRRGILPEWMARTLASPGATEPDRVDPSLRHALGSIAERDGRVLRIVYNPSVNPPLIITAYFDRSRRGTL